MTKHINLSDLSALHAAIDTWYAALPDDTPPAKATLKLTPGPGTIKADVTPDPARTLVSIRFGRNGADTSGAGLWLSDASLARTFTFDKLLPVPYQINAFLVYADQPGITATGQATPLPVAVPVTPPVVTPPIVTASTDGEWLSGAFTAGSADTFKAMGTWLGRPLEIYSTFTSRENAAAMENMWWLNDAPPAVPVTIGLPMCLSSGLGENLSASFTRMAAAMKASGRTFWIRLGWEMNLPNWDWKVTDSNLLTWRGRWSQYYDLFKGALGDKALIGFNPNVGANQSGLSGSILRAWVDGKVDWCGPDAYDCWPPFTTDAAVAEQMNRDQGLAWWTKTAVAKNVPLCLPEWGVSSGKQWAGHQGNDNPRYITEMVAWLKDAADRGRGVGFDTYFNEPADYVSSAIYPLGTNGQAAAAYRKLLGA